MIGNSFIFQHDGDSKHAASAVNNIQTTKTVTDWPSHSPDLYAINLPWDHLDRKLNERQKRWKKSSERPSGSPENYSWRRVQAMMKISSHTQRKGPIFSLSARTHFLLSDLGLKFYSQSSKLIWKVWKLNNKVAPENREIPRVNHRPSVLLQFILCYKVSLCFEGWRTAAITYAHLSWTKDKHRRRQTSQDTALR